LEAKLATVFQNKEHQSYLVFCDTNNVIICNPNTAKIIHKIPRIVVEEKSDPIKLILLLSPNELVFAFYSSFSIYNRAKQRVTHTLESAINMSNSIASNYTIVSYSNTELHAWFVDSNKTYKKKSPCGIVLEAEFCEDTIITCHPKTTFCIFTKRLEQIKSVAPLDLPRVHSFGIWDKSTVVFRHDTATVFYNLETTSVQVWGDLKNAGMNALYCLKRLGNKIVYIDFQGEHTLNVMDIDTRQVELKQKWQVALSGLYHPFSVVGSLIVFVRDNGIVFLDTKSGKEVNKITEFTVDSTIDTYSFSKKPIY
jgi:hypothetical protein